MVVFTGFFKWKLCNSVEHNWLKWLLRAVDYKYGIRLTCNSNKKDYIMLYARNEHDRTKFVEDLKEAILEVNLVI